MKTAKKKITKANTDLPETKDDKAHLKQEEVTFDLPEVKDIPGQEHIHVPKMREFADTTISSDGEEGTRIFEQEEDDISSETNVTKEERQTLEEAAEQSGNVKDDLNLRQAQLDNTDEDGEQLNEEINVSGSDLDIPGSEDDDANEEIGEEDEENNSFSLDSEDEDNSISKQ
jgi:hypothetical protein